MAINTARRLDTPRLRKQVRPRKSRFTPRVIERGPLRRYVAELVTPGVHARAVVEDSETFIDAAIRFAENHAAAGDDDAARILVTDRESGLSRCFTLDFVSRAVRNC